MRTCLVLSPRRFTLIELLVVMSVMNFKDDSFESGSAGFRSWSRSKVEFDNVDVIQNKQ